MALCAVRPDAGPPSSPAPGGRGPPIAVPLPIALVTAPGPATARTPEFDVTCASSDARAVGPDATAAELDATAVGPDATAAEPDARAVGPDATVAGLDAPPRGPDATAVGPDATGVGRDTWLAPSRLAAAVRPLIAARRDPTEPRPDCRARRPRACALSSERRRSAFVRSSCPIPRCGAADPRPRESAAPGFPPVGPTLLSEPIRGD
jgi:hypothetical protein